MQLSKGQAAARVPAARSLTPTSRRLNPRSRPQPSPHQLVRSQLAALVEAALDEDEAAPKGVVGAVMALLAQLVVVRLHQLAQVLRQLLTRLLETGSHLRPHIGGGLEGGGGHTAAGE